MTITVAFRILRIIAVLGLGYLLLSGIGDFLAHAKGLVQP